jgi:twitching motility protein PilT
MDLNEILKAAVQHGASDVHIVPWRPPTLRIDGKMRALSVDPLGPDDTQKLIFDALREDLVERFERDGELDTSYEMGDARFRLNVLEQNDGYGAVLRVIPTEIPTPEFLGLDAVILELTKLPRGIVLVTGPTGSGKSTTLASMINIINAERHGHILTIEDPIEYIYPKLGCVVTQREIGTHSHSFQASLKRAMRQDPDVILVGEMRDLETIGAALTLAETGHLVFSTLHTTDAAQTVDRIIDVFPPHQQQQVRAQLAGTLKAVISQQLLPRASGQGRIAAREVLIVNAAVANLIRDGKTHQIYSAIEVGGKVGMRTLDKDLARLVQEGLVTVDAAVAKASSPSAVARIAGGGM